MCHVIVNMVDETCRVKTIVSPKTWTNQNQTFKIQQTLDFERPALVDAMEFLQASQIPKPGTEQQLTTFAHTARHIDPQLPYTRGISHGQTFGALTYTHKPITSDLQDLTRSTN